MPSFQRVGVRRGRQVLFPTHPHSTPGSEAVRTSDAVTFFRTIPIFYELADDELNTLANAAQEQSFASGETLLEPDADEARLFILLEGECQAFVEHRGSGCEVELRRFYPGEHFGAESVLAGVKSAARVRALSASRALVLPAPTVTATARCIGAVCPRTVSGLCGRAAACGSVSIAEFSSFTCRTFRMPSRRVG